MSDALIQDLERDGFGHWFAGFIDGEGCFTIDRAKDARTGYEYFRCRVSIALRDDDRGALEAVVSRTGLGSLSFRPSRRTGDGVSAGQAAWYVSGRHQASTLVSILDRFPLRAKKAADYKIWREAVSEWNRLGGRGGRRSDFGRMSVLKQELEIGRVYRPGPYEEECAPGARFSRTSATTLFTDHAEVAPI